MKIYYEKQKPPTGEGLKVNQIILNFNSCIEVMSELVCV
jgi:hypothetical protein